MDRAPGIAVALIEEGKLSWEGYYGLADRAGKIPVSATTMFEAGSLSKLFTCAAVLQLQARGLIDLDRPFLEYVPDFSVGSDYPSGAEAITIRMLLTHRSGLMSDDDEWETTHPERYLYRALLPYLRDKRLSSEPGRAMRYSSFGFNLLGLLVERVSGLDYALYMERNILGPLGMEGASFDYETLEAADLARAYGYNKAWDKIPLDEIRPAGSLRATAGGLAQFAVMILNGGRIEDSVVLSPTAEAAMTAIQPVEGMDVPGDTMALGFFAERLPSGVAGSQGATILYHFGSGRHRTMMVLVPSRRAGLVLCSNDWSVDRSPADLFARVRGIFQKQVLR